MDDLKLSVDQAGELQAAFRRGGWTNEEITLAYGGDLLADFRAVLLGHAKITFPEHLIDCDAAPFIPKGWTILSDEEQLANRVRGQFKWNAKKIVLHLGECQRKGMIIKGNKLREELATVPVLTAHVLDYLLMPDHLYLIPDDWKKDEAGNTGRIYFWGTIYCDLDGGLCIRCLCWDGDGWVWNYCWLDGDFNDLDPAASLTN